MDREFEALSESFMAEFPGLSPVSATQLGDHRFDGDVDEVSAEARSRQLEFNREYLEKLSAISWQELSTANQVDAALLANRLNRNIWRLEELQEWAWNPTVYTRLSGNAIYGLMAREFAPLTQRLKHVADRLEEFPRLFEQIKSTLDPSRVPRVHAETAVKQNRGVITVMDNTVVPHLDLLSRPDRRRLRRAIRGARRVVERHQKWLEGDLLPGAEGDFRLGRDLYAQKLAYTLQSPLTKEEIRQRADLEFHKTRNEMYDIAMEIYRQEYPYTRFPEQPSDAYKQSIIRACLEIAYRQRPSRDQIVQEVKQSLELTTRFVRRANFLTLPDDPIEIIVMPEYRRGVALAYCDSPGPLEVGLKTFYGVSPLPENWTEQQVDSFLREYNVRSLHNLTIHEAMPGHFVQLAHSNRNPSRLRSVLSSGPFVEGWAIYAERMMMGEGFLDGDPLMKLIVLKWYLRGIANAIMDQEIHAGDMTREEAMELMMEQTFQEEREAAGKWVRAQLTSTQLSTYFVGYQEHSDLRHEVERSWGQDFSLKKYNDTVLSFGSPPLQYVRALMLDLPIPKEPWRKLRR